MELEIVGVVIGAVVVFVLYKMLSAKPRQASEPEPRFPV